MTPDRSPEETTSPRPTSQKPYESFLLAEYTNIAQAFFNTGTTITHFFQFYLLILGIPITMVGVLSKVSGAPLDIDALWASRLAPYLTILFGVVAAVGICMMAYVTNLRLDALLYARTINGIRKYFTDRSGLSIDQELAIRTLPRSTHQPRYDERRMFPWVVTAFAILNSVYAAAAVFPYLDNALWVAVAVFTLHFVLYIWLVQYRERRYLRTRIIGVDIDGVISDHRVTFCEILQTTSGKAIDAAAITRIPVHECSGLNVSEGDEHHVFNRPDYWNRMVTHENAAKRIRQLKEVFGFDIYVFTHRPWPNRGTVTLEELSYWVPKGLKWLPVRLKKWLVGRPWMMKRVTRKWLKRMGIRYDRLLVERGNVYMPDPRSRTKNRFTLSQQKEIRIFVDDDLDKAKKLANINEIVFLFDQPYNQVPASELPPNLIRIRSWDEIYAFVRERL